LRQHPSITTSEPAGESRRQGGASREIMMDAKVEGHLVEHRLLHLIDDVRLV
jgi:hypothetical protein